MVARAVSARGLLTPLAILVPIVATPIVALWALSTDPVATGPAFALLALGGGITAIAVAGRLTYGVRVSVLTTIATWIVGILVWPAWYAISINTSICGKSIDHAWGWLPPTAGALAFALVGGWGLRTHRGLWAVPLALVLGFLVLLGLYALVPGAQGFCET